jgi:hypothetical protein
LLHAAHGLWSCPGCRTGVDAGHADLVADHVRDCARSDTAAPTHSGRR